VLSQKEFDDKFYELQRICHEDAIDADRSKMYEIKFSVGPSLKDCGLYLLKSKGIKHDIPIFQITYDGSCDSGSVDDVNYLDASYKKLETCIFETNSIPLEPEEILYLKLHKFFSVYASYQHTTNYSLSEFVTAVLEDFIPDGYEINDGGRGEVSFVVADNQVKIHSVTRVMTEEEEENIINI